MTSRLQFDRAPNFEQGNETSYQEYCAQSQIETHRGEDEKAQIEQICRAHVTQSTNWIPVNRRQDENYDCLSTGKEPGEEVIDL